MPGKVPAGIGGAGYDPAQTCVGMNKSVRVQGDAKMELAWPDAPHHDIASSEGPLC